MKDGGRAAHEPNKACTTKITKPNCRQIGQLYEYLSVGTFGVYRTEVLVGFLSSLAQPSLVQLAALSRAQVKIVITGET